MGRGRFLRELTIRQLRALAAVHQHGPSPRRPSNFISPSPRSRFSSATCKALAGLPLIQRTGDGMLLTHAGREVLALTERIEAADRILRSFARHDRGQDRRTCFRSAPSAPRSNFVLVCDLRIFERPIRMSMSTALDRKSPGDRHCAARI